jgi:hypothetical protein
MVPSIELSLDFALKGFGFKTLPVGFGVINVASCKPKSNLELMAPPIDHEALEITKSKIYLPGQAVFLFYNRAGGLTF